MLRHPVERPAEPPEPRHVLATIADPDGRRVVLDAGGGHVLANHGELAAHRPAVRETVARPNHRRPDRRPGRERYCRRDVGPSRWCLVVVDFTVAPARIVTALRTRRGPPDWPAGARPAGGSG